MLIICLLYYNADAFETQWFTSSHLTGQTDSRDSDLGPGLRVENSFITGVTPTPNRQSVIGMTHWAKREGIPEDLDE